MLKKIRALCALPGCTRRFVKRSNRQKFCSPNHTQKFWADVTRKGRDYTLGRGKKEGA